MKAIKAFVYSARPRGYEKQEIKEESFSLHCKLLDPAVQLQAISKNTAESVSIWYYKHLGIKINNHT